MMELLFLLGFSLHNIEEALWLPAWSVHAKRYHKPVTAGEFRFAVIIVTAIGCLFTFQYFIFSGAYIPRCIYLGFVLMMVLNALFPHLAATVALRRYAPGTATALLLNVPIGSFILVTSIGSESELLQVLAAAAAVTAIMLPLIKLLFIAGKKIAE